MNKNQSIEKIGNYLFFHPHIGRGSFSKVYRGQNINCKNDDVAIKKINKIKVEKILDRIEKEIEIIKSLNHPNIIQYKNIFTDDNNIYIVSEYCNGGTLKELIETCLSEKEKKTCMIQIKNAMKYLIDRNIYHRDIKPQNIFINYENEDILYRDNIILKIGDFGFAKQIENDEMNNTLCGTPMYMAPEIMEEKKYYITSDLWSIGIIFYQIIYGKYPFGNPKNIMELLKTINQQERSFSDKSKSDSLSNLIFCLLVKNPIKRLTWNEFFNHSYWNFENKINTEIKPKIDSVEIIENYYSFSYPSVPMKIKPKISSIYISSFGNKIINSLETIKKSMSL